MYNGYIGGRAGRPDGVVSGTGGVGSIGSIRGLGCMNNMTGLGCKEGIGGVEGMPLAAILEFWCVLRV